MKEKIIIYHGSHDIIKKPTFGLGNRFNDYGLGFYTTEHLSLAKEWATDESEGGYANSYELDLKDLKILNLNSKKYSVLHWISVLLSNRKVSTSSYLEEEAKEYILSHYKINTDDYDIIIGYRADDSYFGYARDFLSNSITVEQLESLLKLGDLGNQIVIKSRRAFSRLRFIEAIEATQKTFYFMKKTRDDAARIAYSSNKKGGSIRKGRFIVDLLREEEEKDD